MTIKQENKILTEFAVNGCLHHLGFSPQKNMVHLLEGGFETVSTSMGIVTTPNYVLFHVGACDTQIRYDGVNFEVLE